MKRFHLTYLLLMIPALLQAQVTGADSLFQIQADSLAEDTLATPADTLLAGAIDIEPWRFRHPIGADTASSDSLLRWQIWPDWTWKKNRDPGAVTWRMGTIGRNNAVQTHAQEARYQELYWEDMPMNDPVSGTLNWGVLPLNKVSLITEEDVGTAHRTRYYLKRYHLTEPLSVISYSESSFNTRSLDFMVSHNLGRRTNAEISYRDRRDGGAFPNREVNGSQIFARASHQLDRRQELSLQILNSSYIAGQPFGYVMSDMRAFDFNRFNAAALEPTAESEWGSTAILLGYYRRPPADSLNTFQAGAWFNNRKRDFRYTGDRTAYAVRTAGSSVRRHWRWNRFSADAALRMEHHFNSGGEEGGPDRGYWADYTAEAGVQIRPIEPLTFSGGGEWALRSDGYSAWRLNAGAAFRPIEAFELSGGYASGSVMPTPQQLYWESLDFSGNGSLDNETVDELHGRMKLTLFGRLTAGVEIQTKRIGGGIMMGSDSVFVNSPEYRSNSATGFMKYDHPRFELSGSATLQRLQDEGFGPGLFRGTYPKERLWLKGGAFWKGYLFDRATFVKAGVWAMASPYRYQPDHYRPPLDFWQPQGEEGLLPRFNRVDVDISARVRTIMITLRWENVLDDLVQLGYFETARYPMPQRRFMVGIRAQFRN